MKIRYGSAVLSLASLLSAGSVAAQVPDGACAAAKFGTNEIRLYAEPLAYEVLSDGAALVPKTPIALALDVRGAHAARPSVSRGTTKGAEKTPVYKKGEIDLSMNWTLADFGDFAVRLAARRDGVAWRFETKEPCTVLSESANVTVPRSARCWFNRTWRDQLGCEETWPEATDATRLGEFNWMVYYLPFVYSANGRTVAVVEANLHRYPVWSLDGVSGTPEGDIRLGSIFAKYPRRTEGEGGGRWIRVKETEDYLVKAPGARALPWRAFIIAESPSKLCEADMVYALSKPPKGDFSWVKPGKVSWDWWNGFDNQGGAGCNTATYRRFIDFASKNGVEYVILDEGWSDGLNIWKFNAAVDVPQIIEYAKERNVGIILWMAWAQAFGREEKVAEHFAKMGAKGLKVDFIDRGDAEAAAFKERFAAACAKHRLLLDYHGAFRPVGLNRTWPNILNYEGIHGLEQMKWAEKTKDMPHNDVAACFQRMTAGPLDYTSGAMDNYPVGEYAGTGDNPGSVGTRAHQMALMALYEAPLQMLCDSPTKYEKNAECLAFMAKVPTVWEDVRGLGGTPETFAAIARKAKGGVWYAAGITNSEARDFELDTSFLGKGVWTAEVFRDAPDSDKSPTHYVRETKRVKSGEKMALRMARGGGFAVRFAPVR